MKRRHFLAAELRRLHLTGDPPVPNDPTLNMTIGILLLVGLALAFWAVLAWQKRVTSRPLYVLHARVYENVRLILTSGHQRDWKVHRMADGSPFSIEFYDAAGFSKVSFNLKGDEVTYLWVDGTDVFRTLRDTSEVNHVVAAWRIMRMSAWCHALARRLDADHRKKVRDEIYQKRHCLEMETMNKVADASDQLVKPSDGMMLAR